MMMVVLTGCTTVTNINPRYPRVESILHHNSQMEYDGRITSIVPGTNTVLQLGITRYSGHPISTAHSDFDKVFLVLPADINKGEMFTCSTDDNSLFYWGFSGYNSWGRADKSNTCASIRIESTGDRYFVAHVELSFKVEHLSDQRSSREKRIIVVNDAFLFENEN